MSQQPGPPQTLGSHGVSIEEPDLLHVRCIGEMSAADVKQITTFAESQLVRLAGSYMLVDLRQAKGMPQEARRLVADWLRDHHMAAVVNYGAGMMSRTFSSLAIRALRLLHGQTVENVFVATEAEAQAWVARHRAQRKAGSPP